MIRTFAAVFAVTLVAACASTPAEPIIRTIEVQVPVATTCVPANAQVEPNFRVNREDIVAASDASERLRLLGAGFLERDAWIAEARVVLRGCK